MRALCILQGKRIHVQNDRDTCEKAQGGIERECARKIVELFYTLKAQRGGEVLFRGDFECRVREELAIRERTRRDAPIATCVWLLRERRRRDRRWSVSDEWERHMMRVWSSPLRTYSKPVERNSAMLIRSLWMCRTHAHASATRSSSSLEKSKLVPIDAILPRKLFQPRELLRMQFPRCTSLFVKRGISRNSPGRSSRRDDNV